ncbi:MAG TPA: hypothetical protein VLH87_03615 [Pyrinomonadaceae bacterium]|nr:hypothetical protein [Pyrinomonadaceae bacterium]
MPFEGGEIKTFEPVSPADGNALNVGVLWSPDGRSIFYVSARDGTPNL